MAYQEALEAAGATVHVFEQFGSYQGDWWALVTANGQTGWIHGSYGSCSGCDAFEAEFGYGEEDECEAHRFKGHQPKCADCRTVKSGYAGKLASFGAGYLDAIVSQEEAEAEAARNLDWDSDAQVMLDYIKANAPAKD